MTLSTSLSQRFGLTAPILSAPMAGIAGGALAAAVSRAGGLGLIGGGYGDREWLTRELDLVHEIESAAAVVSRIASEAEGRLREFQTGAARL